jgi:transposase
VKQLEHDIERKLQDHEVGKLLTTIDGIGARTAACLIAELGNPSRFRDAAALASYVGVVPRLRQSGKRAFSGARGLPLGNARLRHRLWMPTLVAVRKNPWLRAHYERLLAAGKRPKLALVACMRKLLGAIYSVARNRRPFVLHLATAGHEQPDGGLTEKYKASLPGRPKNALFFDPTDVANSAVNRLGINHAGAVIGRYG